MDFKYNRKLGAVILVIVLLLGTAYGIVKNRNYGHEPSKGAYYDDQAGVLSEKAIETIESFNALGKGTLLVQTVKSTNPQTCYDYSLDLAYSLADQGKLSSQTGMILVMAIDDGDYTFLFGDSLNGMNDRTWESLRDKYVEPSFAKGDYSQAVIDFCGALDSVLGRANSGSSQNRAGFGISGIFISIIIIVLIFALFSGGRKNRRTPPPTMMGPGSYSRPYRSSTYTTPRSGSTYYYYGGNTAPRPTTGSSSYSSNRSSYSSNRSSYSGSGSSSYSSGRSGFSGGSRVGFTGNSSSRSSSSYSSRSSSSFSSSRSSSSSSRSFSSGSRSGFSGGSRSGFSGGGRK